VVVEKHVRQERCTGKWVVLAILISFLATRSKTRQSLKPSSEKRFSPTGAQAFIPFLVDAVAFLIMSVACAAIVTIHIGHGIWGAVIGVSEALVATSLVLLCFLAVDRTAKRYRVGSWDRDSLRGLVTWVTAVFLTTATIWFMYVISKDYVGTDWGHLFHSHLLDVVTLWGLAWWFGRCVTSKHRSLSALSGAIALALSGVAALLFVQDASYGIMVGTHRYPVAGTFAYVQIALWAAAFTVVGSVAGARVYQGPDLSTMSY
jgi:hypothetical protein